MRAGGFSWFVSVATLMWSGASFAVDVQVGPVQVVDPVPTFTPANARTWGVASDGFDWLVLSHGYANSLGGSRVSAEGEVLDQPPFEIADPLNLWYAALAFDGLNYVVAWGEYEYEGDPFHIKLRRIATDGSLVGDPVTVVTIDPLPLNMGPMTMASGPNGDLIVWCSGDGSGVCEWATVEGSTVGATDSVSFGSQVSDLNVAPSGSSWLITVSTADYDILGARVGPDGLAVDDPPLSIAATDAVENFPTSAAAAADGWAMVFAQGGELWSAEVSASGIVTLGSEPVFSDQPPLYDPRLEALPSGYVVGGERDGDSVVALFLDSTLTPVGPVVNVYSGSPYSLGPGTPSWASDALLVTWGQSLYAGYTPYGARLDGDGQLLDAEPFPIVMRPTWQDSPQAAYAAGAWLTAWTEEGLPGPSSVYAQRLDESGAPLSVTPLQIANEGLEEKVVAVAGSPAGWLVVWNDEYYRLRAKRIGLDGTPLDVEPLELGECWACGAHAISDGANWIVSWLEIDGYVNVGTASIARINAAGEFIDGSPIAVSGVNDSDGMVGVSIDEVGYAVSWQPLSGGLVVRHVDFCGALVGDAPTTVLASNEPVWWHELEYRNGDGWLAWVRDDIYSGSFESLGSGLLPTVFYPGYGFDLTRMGARALLVWPDEAQHHLGIAEEHGALETKLTLELDAFLTTSPRLATKDPSTALLTFVSEVELGATVAGRIKSRLVQLVNDAEPPPNDPQYPGCAEGGSGGDTGGAAGETAGGAAGETAGGAAGETAGGSAAGGANGGSVNGGSPPAEGGATGAAGATSAGGEGGSIDAPGGAPSASAGTTSSGGTAGNTAGSGGAAGAGTNSKSGSHTRGVAGCTCRTSPVQQGAAPWLAVAAALAALNRRRRPRAA